MPCAGVAPRGNTVAAETCPQYLLLDVERVRRARTTTASHARAFVMSPPLRTASDREALWAALASGDVQFVGTDHCSFDLVGQKDRAADFAHVPNGASRASSSRMALMYSAGRRRRDGWDLTRFAEVTATNAARYFGLYPRKGALLPGADADVVVIDPRRRGRSPMDDAPRERRPHALRGPRGARPRARRLPARPPRRRDGRLAPDLPVGRYLPCGPPDTVR